MEITAAQASAPSPPTNRNPRNAWKSIWTQAWNIYQLHGNVGFTEANNLMVAITAIPYKGLFVNNDMTDDVGTQLLEFDLQNNAKSLCSLYSPIYANIQNQSVNKISDFDWEQFKNFLDLTKP